MERTRVTTDSAAHAEWEDMALASTRGAFARSHGDAGIANPFLLAAAMPFNTGESHASWFSKCDAWWRGWDAEDDKRLSHLPGTCAERSASLVRN